MIRGIRFGIRATAVALLSAGLIAMTVVFAEPQPSGPKSDLPVTDKEVEVRVQQLVESMTDSKEQVRDSAYEALKALGERALPTLKKLAEGDSPQATAARRGI